MKRRKVTIIGAGNVGGTTAQRLVELNVADIVLLDIDPDIARGKALDIAQASALYGYEATIVGTDDYGETVGSDLVIITSGVPRKPGMSRDDLLKVNTQIVKSVTEQVVKTSPDAILIVVSNPLDAMTYVAYRVSGFPKNRVMGMAGVLDSARFRALIAHELKVSVRGIQALVLGGHGDTMVPLTSSSSVGGIPLNGLLGKDRLDAIVKRTREGGAEIVSYLKTGSAYYAPSAAIVEMAISILQDRKSVLPCAVLCEGEFGVNGLFVGVPVVLGHGGVERIVEIDLGLEEQRAFQRSVEAVSELCEIVGRLL